MIAHNKYRIVQHSLVLYHNRGGRSCGVITGQNAIPCSFIVTLLSLQRSNITIFSRTVMRPYLKKTVIFKLTNTESVIRPSRRILAFVPMCTLLVSIWYYDMINIKTCNRLCEGKCFIIYIFYSYKFDNTHIEARWMKNWNNFLPPPSPTCRYRNLSRATSTAGYIIIIIISYKCNFYILSKRGTVYLLKVNGERPGRQQFILLYNNSNVLYK